MVFNSAFKGLSRRMVFFELNRDQAHSGLTCYKSQLCTILQFKFFTLFSDFDANTQESILKYSTAIFSPSPHETTFIVIMYAS